MECTNGHEMEYIEPVFDEPDPITGHKQTQGNPYYRCDACEEICVSVTAEGTSN